MTNRDEGKLGSYSMETTHALNKKSLVYEFNMEMISMFGALGILIIVESMV